MPLTVACLFGGPCDGEQVHVDHDDHIVVVIEDLAHWYAPTDQVGTGVCATTGQKLPVRRYQHTGAEPKENLAVIEED